jgi:hypothetical protein
VVFDVGIVVYREVGFICIERSWLNRCGLGRVCVIMHISVFSGFVGVVEQDTCVVQNTVYRVSSCICAAFCSRIKVSNLSSESLHAWSKREHPGSVSLFVVRLSTPSIYLVERSRTTRARTIAVLCLPNSIMKYVSPITWT